MCCLFFAIGGRLLVVKTWVCLFVVRNWLSAVWRSLCVVLCSVVDCCALLVARCVLLVACYLFIVAWCLLSVVGSL